MIRQTAELYLYVFWSIVHMRIREQHEQIYLSGVY